VRKQRSIVVMFTLLTLLLATAATAELSARPDLIVSFLSHNPDPIQPGQTMDVFIQVENRGLVSENSELFIVDEYPFTVERTDDYFRARNLGPIAFPQRLHFRVKIAEDATDGTTPLRVRYKGEIVDGLYSEKIFDINIETFDATLTILSIEQFPKELLPGQEGTLSITLENRDDQELRNVDVLFDLTETYSPNSIIDNALASQSLINARLEQVNRRVALGQSPLTGPSPMMGSSQEMMPSPTSYKSIAPVGVTNQLRVGNLPPGSKTTVTMPIRALPDATIGIHAIPTYITYNDEENNPFHSRVDSPIIIDMESDLHVALMSTDMRTTDFSGKINIELANKGLSTLNYVTVTLDDDESYRLLTAPQSSYLGIMQSGNKSVASFEVIPESDSVSIPVTITYRDSFNREQIEHVTLTHELINRNYYRNLSFEMWFAWIILALVVLAVTLYLVRMVNREKE
jgi:hypothetical protein